MRSSLPSAEAPAGAELLELVRRQVELGPRCPGAAGHRAAREWIAGRLAAAADEWACQEFQVELPWGPAECANLAGVFQARTPAAKPLLLGTHFDTRWIADREPEPARRGQPIPGANDGGSGTAIFLGLLPILARLAGALPRDVQVVFFDAEDVGDIGGLPFSAGARRYARRPPLRLPGEVLILDMVGGRGLELDVDAHAFAHAPGLRLTREVFSLGRELDGRIFAGRKVKPVISDHFPFLQAGIPSCLLIDLDYPEWHTQGDLPDALADHSLATVAAVVLRFLLRPPR